MLLHACQQVANQNHYEHSPWLVTASLVFTLAAVYAARMAVIAHRVRSLRLGEARRRRGAGEGQIKRPPVP